MPENKHKVIVSCGHGTFEIVPDEQGQLLPCGCVYDEIPQANNPQPHSGWGLGMYSDMEVSLQMSHETFLKGMTARETREYRTNEERGLAEEESHAT